MIDDEGFLLFLDSLLLFGFFCSRYCPSIGKKLWNCKEYRWVCMVVFSA
jgi:hypothetical protein